MLFESLDWLCIRQWLYEGSGTVLLQTTTTPTNWQKGGRKEGGFTLKYLNRKKLQEVRLTRQGVNFEGGFGTAMQAMGGEVHCSELL